MPEIEEEAAFGVTNNVLFGKYELGKLLGCGAFAKVYHARDKSGGQSVAVKVVNKKKVAANPSLMSNIKREIAIMRRLSHRHIVKLHEVMATRTKIYFVMEYVKGGELFNKVSKQGRFDEDQARRTFRQLISAVGYCHSRGVYHRDLKPENLLVDDNGDLKVSDFGLSALSNQIRTDGLLHTLCGTPAYVAPEILSKRGYDGAKVDVWSCGVVLFVLAAGHLPFNDPNLMNMYKKIYKGEYRTPKWMSPDLKRFISRLLDTNPKTRITIDEILIDPWFAKDGYEPIKIYDDETDQDLDLNTVTSESQNEEAEVVKNLNAFDLISFSSGLDLSGLFISSNDSAEDSERFISRESPEKLIEKIELFAKSEELRKTKKKEWGFELEGRNCDFRIRLDLFRVNDEVVVVEARRIGGEVGCYTDLWKNKLRRNLTGLTEPETKPEPESLVTN